MDFQKKEIGVIDSLIPTGNINEDMLLIQDKYKKVKAKKKRTWKRRKRAKVEKTKKAESENEEKVNKKKKW